MAQRFVLTAQLQLQAPTNVRSVVGQIRKQLQGVNVNVGVTANTRQLTQVNKQFQAVSKSAQGASKNVQQLGTTIGQAARRFSVITVATGTLIGFARSVKNATKEAIEFEREVVRISQVTGKSVSQLRGLTAEVRNLATTFGVSSKEILTAARTLAQAGISADKAQKALRILAQTDLAATFNNIADTTEGAIALLNQFRKEAAQTGGEIAFLERSLGAINSVSKKFAVESKDLISVIRRTGGVFESAGGSINELIALFTSVRSTTRESADTIATGFRTIFTRVQRVDTIEQLKKFGIELQDLEGRFVGPMEAVRRLSTALAGLDPKDFRFNLIVEQLGGFRQIGKVIPLIKQFAVAQEALKVAQSGSGSIAKDAATAQQALSVQIQKVREEFSQLIAKFADSETFKTLANGALLLARSFIKVADSLTPLLPLITTLFAMKIGRGLAPALGAISGVKKFAAGGLVPGSGNRDTVPAMLTPGEFVIRKSSVNKMGASNLAAMNNNKYNFGGKVRDFGGVSLFPMDKKVGTGDGNIKLEEIRDVLNRKGKQGAFKDNETAQNNHIRRVLGMGAKEKVVKTQAFGESFSKQDVAQEIDDEVVTSFQGLIESAAKSLAKSTNVEQSMTTASKELVAKVGTASTVGSVFEGAVAMLGAPFLGSKAAVASPFDFEHGLGDNLTSGVFSAQFGKMPVDTKRTLNAAVLEEIANKKAKNYYADIIHDDVSYRGAGARNLAGKKKIVGQRKRTQELKAVFGGENNSDMVKSAAKAGYLVTSTGKDSWTVSPNMRGAAQFNAGGQVDNVPALLTPGEFVIKKSSAQAIGYGNLKQMNKYAAGGIVTAGRNNYGVPDELGFRDTGPGSGSFIPTGRSAPSGINKKAQRNAALIADAQAKHATQVDKLIQQGKLLGNTEKEVNDTLLTFARLVSRGTKAQAALNQVLERTADLTVPPDIAGPTDEHVAARKRKGTGAAPGKAETRPAGVVPYSGNVPFGPEPPEPPKPSDRGLNILEAAKNERIEQIRGKGGELDKVGAREDDNKKKQADLQGRRAQAQAAQQMVFFAGVIGGVIAQTGLFSDAMGNAISSALGMSSTIMGLGGTFIDMADSAKLNKLATEAESLAKQKESLASEATALADGKEVIASEAAAAADAKEAAASSTGGGGKLMGALIAVAVVSAIAQGFKAYFSTRAKDEQRKGDEISQKARDSGVANLAGLQARRTQALQEESMGEATSTGALAGGLVGGAIGLKWGAAIGTAVAPVIGTAVGAAVGGALGAAVGAGAGSLMGGASDPALQAAKGLAEAEMQASLSIYKLSQGLDNINLQKLEGMERLGAIAGQAAQQTKELTEARAKEIEATKLQKQSATGTFLGRMTGGFVGRARGDLTEQQEAQQKAAQEANQQARKSARQNLLPKLLSDLERQGAQMISSGTSAAEVQKRLADAQNKYIEAVIASSELGPEAARKQAEESLSALQDGRKAQEDQYKKQQAIEKAAEAARKREKQLILEVNSALAQLATVDKYITKFNSGLSSAVGVLQGNFRATGGPATPIGDIANVVDFDEFNSEVDRAGARLGEPGRRMAKEIKGTAQNIQNLRNNLDEQGLGSLSQGAGPKAIEDALRRSGVNIDAMTDEMRKALVSKIKALAGNIDQASLDDIVDDLVASEQKRVDALNKATEQFAKNVQAYDNAWKQLIAQKNREIAATQQYLDVIERNSETLAKAQGRTRTRGAREGARTARAQVALQGTGVQAGDVAGAAASARAARSAMEMSNAFDQAGTSTDATIKLGNEAANTYKKTTDELKRLANQTGRTADVMSELEREQAKRKQVADTVKEFTFATNQGRADMMRSFLALQRVLQSGTLASIPDSMRSAVGGLLDKFSDIDLFGGMTGADISKQLQIQELDKFIRMSTGGQQGISQQQIKQIFESTSKEDKLVNDLRTIANEEVAAQRELMNLEKENTVTLQRVLTQLGAYLQQIQNRLPGVTPEKKAFGGPVYKADGGTIFKPRGTDTVPAMLTPGEFVIRKSAVDRIGAGTLAAMNAGGGPVYRASGGGVMDTDSALNLYYSRHRRGGAPKVNRLYKDAASQMGLSVADILKTIFKGDPTKLKGDPGADVIRQMVGGLQSNRDIFDQISGRGVKISKLADTGKVQALGSMVAQVGARLKGPAGNLLLTTVPEFFSQLNALQGAITNFMGRKKGEDTIAQQVGGFGGKSRGSEIRNIRKKFDVGQNVVDTKGEKEGKQPATLRDTQKARKRKTPDEIAEIRKDREAKKYAPYESKTEFLEAKKEKYQQRRRERDPAYAASQDAKEAKRVEQEADRNNRKAVLADIKRSYDIESLDKLLRDPNTAPDAYAAAMEGKKLRLAKQQAVSEAAQKKHWDDRALQAAQQEKEKADFDKRVGLRDKEGRSIPDPSGVNVGTDWAVLDPLTRDEDNPQGKPHLSPLGYMTDRRTKAGERLTKKLQLAYIQHKIDQAKYEQSPFGSDTWVEDQRAKQLGHASAAEERKEAVASEEAGRKRRDARRGFEDRSGGLGIATTDFSKPDHLQTSQMKVSDMGVDSALAQQQEEERKRMAAARAKSHAHDTTLLYNATGGSVDSVPAMLTPGEFVMSKDAVKSHGMGFMKQLNQGKIQGFNQGGPVYRQRGGGIFGRGRGGGGAMSVDTSAISQAFETFNTNLSEIFNQAMPAFTMLTTALNNLAAAWSQGLVMTHQMNVNGGLNLPGIDGAAIGEQIASALGENVAGQVEGLIKAQGDQFRTA